MPKKRMFSQEEKNKIIEEYLQGKTIKQLSNIFSCRQSSVSNILKEADVFKGYAKKRLGKDIEKEICNLYQTGHYNLKILSEKYNTSVHLIKKILLENNISIESYKIRHTNINLKEDFFEVIDSEEKAYFLGFILADGCIDGNQLSIEINKKDIEILYKFKKAVSSNAKISERKRDGKIMVCTRVSSEKMILDLAKYGVIPNKTYNTKKLPDLKEPYLHHMLRGFVDGDGWVIYDKEKNYHIIGIVSHFKSMCEDFKEKCNSLLENKITRKIVEENDDSSFRFSCSAKSQVKELATVLYGNANIYLTRKYNKAQKIIKLDEDIV